MEQRCVIYARSINQYKFIYQTVFSASFAKQVEDNQILDETEIFIILRKNHQLTESDLDEIDIKYPLKKQIQQQEMKDSGWRFDKINSMTIYFYKTGDLHGANYVKIHLRSNSILNIEIFDRNRFIWSILASLHPCNSNYSNRVSNCRQYFNEINLDGFDFTNGFRCKDVHGFIE